MTSARRFDELDRGLKGGVITPEDAEYDRVRQMFYVNHDRRPATIVRVADTDDVSRVLDFTGDAGMDVSVRSGGHSLAGSGVIDDAVVIDVRGLDDLDIDLASPGRSGQVPV